MDVHKLLRKDVQGRRGGVSENRDVANKAVILRGVPYGPPCQDEEADEAFCEQQGGVSPWRAPVLVGDFDLLDFCVPKGVYSFVSLFFEEIGALERSCLCSPEN